MINISKRQGEIVQILALNEDKSSSQVFDLLKEKGDSSSLVTIKRDLSDLLDKGFLEKHGEGRSTEYKLSLYGRFFNPIDANKYCLIPPDKRIKEMGFDFNLFKKLDFNLFSEQEYKSLDNATVSYRDKLDPVSDSIYKKELERFIVEFSWKSSQIEGNTYSLIDTERLIEKGERSKNNTDKEAKMILSHKDSLNFILNHKDSFKGEIDRALIDEIHKRVVSGLDINLGLRKSPVGVTGSNFKPIDNKHQIEEALESLCDAINNTEKKYDKAIIALFGISYIQPFDDGNKRTSRLLANAILIANNMAPLSYRSVEESVYKEAVLVFYELQSIIPIKKIFIEQYLFSSRNYLVK